MKKQSALDRYPESRTPIRDWLFFTNFNLSDPLRSES